MGGQVGEPSDRPAGTPALRQWPLPAVLAVVSAGGALGGSARHLVGLALPVPPVGFPWATLLVNLGGCLLLGALLAAVPRESGRWPLRSFAATGVLGSYTTFSAFAVESHALLTAGRAGTAAAYVGSSVLVGVLAAAAGEGLARRLGARARRA